MSCHDKKILQNKMCNFMLNTQTKLIKLVCWAWKELQKSLNIWPLIRKQGPEKNPKLINVGPTSFPEFGVINKNNCNSNLKNLLGFRNMLEKLENIFF